MKRSTSMAGLLFCLASSACGGGDGDGGGSVVVAPMPSPTPTPSPSPVPIQAVFTAEAAGPLLGRIDFFPGGSVAVGGADVVQTFTNRSGVFTYGQTDSLGNYSQSAGGAIIVRQPVYAINAFGIERPTRLIRFATAPSGATTVSPLTALIYTSGSQLAVRNALGLSSGNASAIPDTVDLLTYAASADAGTARLPGIVQAANIRVAALEAAAEIFAASPGGAGFSPRTSTIDNDAIARFIAANPRVSLTGRGGIEQFLRSLRPAGAADAYRDDIYQAAAQLLEVFGAATRAVEDDRSLAPRYSLAVPGLVRTRLLDLSDDNSAAAAARAQTSPALVADAVAIFADQLPFPTGLSFAQPDFVRARAGEALTVYRDDPQFGVNTGAPVARARPSMTYNDVFIDRVNLVIDRAAIVTAVTVPASQAGAITVMLRADQSALVTPRAGFVGTAYYDYSVTFASGAMETGRVYVVLR